MEIQKYNPETARMNKDKKLLIVADYRNVNYYDEQETEQYKLSEELTCNFYPIVMELDYRIKRFLLKQYCDIDIMFVDESLYNYFNKNIK